MHRLWFWVRIAVSICPVDMSSLPQNPKSYPSLTLSKENLAVYRQ